MDQLGTYILELQTQLRDALQKIHPDTVSAQEKITSLQCQLVKKDNEISFLKDTVRIECEERMGLVAILAKHQQPRAQSIAAIPQKASLDHGLGNHQSHLAEKSNDQHHLNPNNPLANALAQVSSSSKSPQPEIYDTLSSKDAEFLRLFKNAAAKNVKRLAKQR